MAFNSKERPILSVGPILGLDATSDPSHVDSQHATVLQNVMPQRSFGAYVTAQGRSAFTTALAGNNAGDPIKFYTSLTAYQYMVYCATTGTIYKFANNVAPSVVKNGLSTSGVGKLIEAQQWAFFTNGVDTPLKIDQSFNVTNWGIVAPTTAPTLAAGVGAQTSSTTNTGSPSTTAASSLVTTTPGAQTTSAKVTCTEHKDGVPGDYIYYYNCSVSGTPTTTSWQVTAAAPVAAGSQLGFTATSITGGNPVNLSLVGPSGSVLQSWTDIVQGTTYNYSNAAAVAGAYTWKCTVDTSSDVGMNLDTPTTGTYSATVTPSITYYSQGGAGGVTNGAQTAILCASSVAPVDASTQISLAITSVVTPTDANGNTSYTVVLSDSTGKVWFTQKNITAATTLHFSDASALAGDYTWVVFATVTPTGGGASTYTCSCSLTATWEQVVTGGLTAGGAYAYIVTFGNATQESSAGAATTFLTLENSNGSASFALSGSTLTAGTIITATFFPNAPNQASGVVTYTLLSTDTLATAAAGLAAAINEAIAQQGNKNISLPQGGATSDNTGVVTIYNPSTNPLPYDGAVTNAGAGNLSITPIPETNCPPASVQTASTLTAIPTSTDPQVTLRNLYRIGGSQAQFELVGTINDNTTTTYTDTLADDAITGQTLVSHRDPPKPFFDIVVYQDRVWGLGFNDGSSPYTSEQVWYSLYRQPWGFDNTNQVLVVGENPGNDQIVGGAALPMMLVVLKRQTGWGISGSSQQDYLPIPLFEIGAASRQSIKSAYGMMFWLSPEGIVYMFDGGGAPVDISSMTSTKCSIKGLLDTYTLADYEASVGFIHKNTYYLSFPTKGVTFGYYIPMQSWFTLTWTATGACYDIANEEVIACSNTAISQWFAAETDLGSAITAQLTSGLIFDEGGGASTARHLIVSSPSNGNVNANVQITAWYEQNSVSNTQTISLASSRQAVSLPPTLVGQTFQMQITTTTSAKTTISNATLFAYSKRALNVKG